MSRSQPGRATRWTVANRTVAAVFGGYVVTSLATTCLARLLPMPAVEATTAATLASFMIGAVIVMAVFTARSSTRIWLWLVAAACVLGGISIASIMLSGRI